MSNCFWGHDFGDWVETNRSDLYRSKDKAAVGLCLVQERKCRRCQYIEIDFQKKFI